MCPYCAHYLLHDFQPSSEVQKEDTRSNKKECAPTEPLEGGKVYWTNGACHRNEVQGSYTKLTCIPTRETGGSTA